MAPAGRAAPPGGGGWGARQPLPAAARHSALPPPPLLPSEGSPPAPPPGGFKPGPRAARPPPGRARGPGAAGEAPERARRGAPRGSGACRDRGGSGAGAAGLLRSACAAAQAERCRATSCQLKGTEKQMKRNLVIAGVSQLADVASVEDGSSSPGCWELAGRSRERCPTARDTDVSSGVIFQTGSALPSKRLCFRSFPAERLLRDDVLSSQSHQQQDFSLS
ncbi:potassium/sodium hyperpolarization-activated cyclic nucleotide-gated channel 2-like [Apus apus]|uniref:potassium/sodium hyperpolarization-activated cyclic nucleotide-gated channel 2-like n=1 Tax=Apus apus TaxID=8895 RepID=UPI0021F91E40|nr:potassium/sodium hyperpolarization-activated cyclic nucleotide-gated channel 2-like [Apus apus]